MQIADKIVMRPLEALIPYAGNARTHSDAQVAQIAGSIREFGFTNPVPTDGDNGIIAGHGRVLAAHLLRMLEVPCVELTDGRSGHWTGDRKQTTLFGDALKRIRHGIEMVSMRQSDHAPCFAS